MTAARRHDIMRWQESGVGVGLKISEYPCSGSPWERSPGSAGQVQDRAHFQKKLDLEENI